MGKLTVRGISTHEESKGEWKRGYLIEDEGQSYIINGYRHPTLGFYTIDSSNFECFFADGVNVGVKEFNENLKYISEGLEVIGNVYENPELLEVGQ